LRAPLAHRGYRPSLPGVAQMPAIPAGL